MNRLAPGDSLTRALAVPCSACLWLRRNLGSVPFSDGYLEVLGFLILQDGSDCQPAIRDLACIKRDSIAPAKCCPESTALSSTRLQHARFCPSRRHVGRSVGGGKPSGVSSNVPVAVRLPRLVVLRRVLGLCRERKAPKRQRTNEILAGKMHKQTGDTYWPL